MADLSNDELYHFIDNEVEQLDIKISSSQITKIINKVCVRQHQTAPLFRDKIYVTIIAHLLRQVPYMINGIDFIMSIKSLIPSTKIYGHDILGNNLIDALLSLDSDKNIDPYQYYRIIVLVSIISNTDMKLHNNNNKTPLQVYINACHNKKTIDTQLIYDYLANGFDANTLHTIAFNIVQNVLCENINFARILYMYGINIFVNVIIEQTLMRDNNFIVDIMYLIRILYDTKIEHVNNRQWYDLVKNFNVEHPNACNNFINLLYNTLVHNYSLTIGSPLYILAIECIQYI